MFKKLFWLWALCLGLMVTAACAPAAPSPIQQTATAIQLALAPQLANATLSALLTAQPNTGQVPLLMITPTPPPLLFTPVGPPCNWTWATQDAPELTAAAQQKIDSSGILLLDSMQVRTQISGQNCLDTNGSVLYFTAVSVDFFLTVRVASLADMPALTEVILTGANTLMDGLTLPARQGYFDIRFSAAEGSGHLRTTFDTIIMTRALGLEGGAFLDALGGVLWD
ncbi:MAG: hypothetical protein HXY40_19030 [Chloroflexi bacterium]|nr:hypothetical protein [Chloroflexota bacterium]